MKKILFFAIVLVVSISNAQSVRVKKGAILIDNEKAGTVEKKGESRVDRYYLIKDNSGTPVYKAQYMLEASRIQCERGQKFYYVIESLTKEKVMGINNMWFAFSEQGVPKFLVKNKLFDKNGVNNEGLDAFLAENPPKPKFVLERIKLEDSLLLRDINYKALRNLDNTNLYVRQSPAPLVEKTTGILQDIILKQREYKIFQGLDADNNTLIGFAVLEYKDNNSKNLYIQNTKGAFLAYLDSVKGYITNPCIEITTPKMFYKVNKPIEAIQTLTKVLIEQGKM